jgi:hypothetical protein
MARFNNQASIKEDTRIASPLLGSVKAGTTLTRVITGCSENSSNNPKKTDRSN